MNAHPRARRIANVVLFQAGWFSDVLLAADGRGGAAAVLTLAIVIGHLVFLAGDRARETRLVLTSGVLGFLVDSALLRGGFLEYAGAATAREGGLAPPWIIALWALFACTFEHSLRGLGGRPWLAAALGAVAAPLSYFAGERLGALRVLEPASAAYAATGIAYAVVLPFLLGWRRPARAA